MQVSRLSAMAALAVILAAGTPLQKSAASTPQVSATAHEQTARPHGRVIIVQRRPPALRVEVRPIRPSGRHVWIGGHWHFKEHRYVWIRGSWVVPPRRGAVYVRPVWKRHGGVYIRVGGVWR